MTGVLLACLNSTFLPEDISSHLQSSKDSRKTIGIVTPFVVEGTREVGEHRVGFSLLCKGSWVIIIYQIISYGKKC